jgi:hypothetical protein
MSGRVKKDIDNIEVSVKTIIAITNIQINLDNLFNYIPITPFVPIEKKRGRKKKSLVEQQVQLLSEGSIVNVQKGKELRGVLLKKKKKSNDTFFLHSVTLVMSLDTNKFINVKISRNGKFQITGCKYDEHAIKTIKYIYKHICIAEVISNTEIKKFKNDNHKEITVLFNTVMQNLDYNIGFNISREKLNTFINDNTDFCSIYEGSISTGVNIKIKSEDPYDKNINRLTFWYDVNNEEEKTNVEVVDYQEYLNLLEEREIKKENKKDKRHTFLVFASGSIIMSSRGPTMKIVFKDLISLLQDNKDMIEEKVV